jgi:NADH dehydrogenase [ubiquinone] 1 alpha subcomplex assembly factor 7
VSAFAAALRARLAADGPLTVERVMALAVAHYYATRTPFGRGGDFITAPEISQMFGELIGLWCAAGYEGIGAPEACALVELGPGRGTLMADALRVTAKLARFSAARRVHLVEASPALRAVQAEALGAASASWHERLDEVPRGALLVIANEFFDALPVRQVVAADAAWHERLVALDADAGGFRFAASGEAAANLPAWLPAPAEVPPGTIAEFGPAREALAGALAARLVRDGGLALIIDYGHVTSGPGDTLQAVRAHRPVEVLTTLGTADLTAQVDFAALAGAAAAAGAHVFGPLGQGRFLQALGIEARAARLLRGATPAQAIAIESALRRLTAPAAMGTLFKVLALSAPGSAVPAGFETSEQQVASERRAVGHG